MKIKIITIKEILEMIKEDINNYFQYFKKNWCEIYSKQFNEANSITEKKKIKNNVYKNINLTEKEKDEVWELIMMFSSY